MVSSEVKDAKKIENVMQIYELIMKNLKDLVDQGRIATALAYSKAKSIHQGLSAVFDYFMVSDEIAEDFVFRQNGLDKFLKLMLNQSSSSADQNSHSQFEEEKIAVNGAEEQNQVTNTNNFASTDSADDEEDELVEFMNERLTKNDNENLSLKDPFEEPYPIKSVKRNITASDFVPNEFARTMTLIDSNISKAKDIASNMDWSVNKKGYRQRLISEKFDPGHNNEIWLLFKLNKFIEIKEIQIGFTNFWTIETEVYVEPSSVIIEAGMTEDELTLHPNASIWSLKKIDDKGFGNFGVTVYGINLYTFNQQNKSENLDGLIDSSFNSLQSIKARYIKVRIRNNFVTWLENSPLWNKYMKPKAIGINYCSIMGYDITNVGNIENTIADIKMKTASKILEMLFKGKFPTTLSRLSTSEEYTDYAKNHLDNLIKLLANDCTSRVVGLMLQTFVAYNKELGNWIIYKCLDLDWESKQVSLLYTLIKCNQEEYLGRLNIVKKFIFEQIAIMASTEDIKQNQIQKLLPFFSTFLDLVTLYTKNLNLKGSEKVQESSENIEAFRGKFWSDLNI